MLLSKLYSIMSKNLIQFSIKNVQLTMYNDNYPIENGGKQTTECFLASSAMLLYLKNFLICSLKSEINP
jgi:hypothetical protein